MRQIKVCHFTSAHKWNDVRIFVKQCSSLAANGFDVTLIAPGAPNQMVNGVKVTGVEPAVGGRYTRMRKTAARVVQKALGINADIYHFHDPELLRYVKKIQRAGKKVIYDSHEDVPRQILGKFWINKYLRRTVSAVFERYENRVSRRADAMKTIEQELGWKYYGGKHYESVFTRFFQAYILPEKFNIDKRKAHLSSLICSGQTTREEALEELKKPLYAPDKLAADKEYVIKKLGLSHEEFEAIMRAPVKSYRDYPNDEKRLRAIYKVYNKMRGR